MSQFKTLFLAFVFALTAAWSQPNTIMAAPDTQIAAPAVPSEEEAAEAEESVQDIWEGIMSQRLKQLEKLQEDAEAFQTMLKEHSKSIQQSSDRARVEYEKLAAIAKISRNMPAELTVLVERARRLLEEMTQLAAPLQAGIKNLQDNYAELSALQQDASAQTSPSVRNLNKALAKLGKNLKSTQKKSDKLLAPILELQKSLQTMEDSLRADMPTLWRDYYLASTSKLLDPTHWDEELEKTESVEEVLSLRMSTEIPQSQNAWMLVGLRALIMLMVLLALVAVANRGASKAPAQLLAVWKRIMSNSAFWLALGLALHFGAWSNGKMYQIVASFGTMSLCWGQMNLAWDLHSFDNPELPQRSPLWCMFVPLFIGMMLLYFDPFPLFLSVCWLVVQAVILWCLHHRTLETDKVARVLMGGFTLMCWCSFGLTFFGLVRLAILSIMAWAAFSVCLQLALALLSAGSKVSDLFPQEGWKGLAAGIIMALAIPSLLLIACAAPILWILAYPGGAYLLHHVATLGFNIGELSFNAIQIVSIVIAFYLTRSLISVGTTFMRSLKNQSMKLNPSLIGPFQTTYTYALWAIFILYLLSSLGFSLTSLTVVAGGLSVGVGFGMQNIVQNFISGLMVIFGRIIREGDVVEVSGVMGVVRKVDIRSTQIETYDNAVVFIPNSDFLSSSFTNWTHNGRRVRREIAIGVAYGSDLPLCMKLLTDIANEHPKVLGYPAPKVLFDDFAASSLNLILRYWVADIDDGVPSMTDIRLRINELFNKNNINICFPQLDVHLHHAGDDTETKDATTEEAMPR